MGPYATTSTAAVFHLYFIPVPECSHVVHLGLSHSHYYAVFMPFTTLNQSSGSPATSYANSPLYPSSNTNTPTATDDRPPYSLRAIITSIIKPATASGPALPSS
jgi:hypothetical protein